MKIKKDILSIISIIIGFILLFFFFRWEGFLWISGLIGIPSLLSPYLRSQVLKGWFKIGYIIGLINSRIILGIIFFLILTPISWLSRLFSGDKMQLKKGVNKESYFKIRNHLYTSQDFENLW